MPVVAVGAKQNRGLQSLAEKVLEVVECIHGNASTGRPLFPHAEGNSNEWQKILLARYEWIERITSRTVRGAERTRSSTTERIDLWVTHRFFGPVILLLVMLLVFVAIFSWATVPMDLIDGASANFRKRCAAICRRVCWRISSADGLIAGLGGATGFSLPQILLLFFFIALLWTTAATWRGRRFCSTG